MPTTVRALLVGATLAAAACGGSSPGTAPSVSNPIAPAPPGPTIPTSTGPLVMTASPIDPAAVQYIIAMGAMSPWGHTLPTDHMYLYHSTAGTSFEPLTLYAPAGGIIMDVGGFASGQRIDIRVDSEYHYWMGPVAITPSLVAGTRVQAGQVIGTTGGFTLDIAVLKLSMSLPFANPARYGRDTLSADGPMKYFDAPVRAALVAKLRRTGADPDGRLNYDVAGTLAGNWFHESLPVSESGIGGDTRGMLKISFARDPQQPDLQRISLGGLGMTNLWAVPASAPQFDSITPASGVVALSLVDTQDPQGPPGTQQRGLLLVQLLDATHLKAEAVQTTAATASFSANAQIYLR